MCFDSFLRSHFLRSYDSHEPLTYLKMQLQRKVDHNLYQSHVKGRLFCILNTAKHASLAVLRPLAYAVFLVVQTFFALAGRNCLTNLCDLDYTALIKRVALIPASFLSELANICRAVAGIIYPKVYYKEDRILSKLAEANIVLNYSVLNEALISQLLAVSTQNIINQAEDSLKILLATISDNSVDPSIKPHQIEIMIARLHDAIFNKVNPIPNANKLRYLYDPIGKLISQQNQFNGYTTPYTLAQILTNLGQKGATVEQLMKAKETLTAICSKYEATHGHMLSKRDEFSTVIKCFHDLSSSSTPEIYLTRLKQFDIENDPIGKYATGLNNDFSADRVGFWKYSLAHLLSRVDQLKDHEVYIEILIEMLTERAQAMKQAQTVYEIVRQEIRQDREEKRSNYSPRTDQELKELGDKNYAEKDSRSSLEQNHKEIISLIINLFTGLESLSSEEVLERLKSLVLPTAKMVLRLELNPFTHNEVQLQKRMKALGATDTQQGSALIFMNYIFKEGGYVNNGILKEMLNSVFNNLSTENLDCLILKLNSISDPIGKYALQQSLNPCDYNQNRFNSRMKELGANDQSKSIASAVFENILTATDPEIAKEKLEIIFADLSSNPVEAIMANFTLIKDPIFDDVAKLRLNPREYNQNRLIQRLSNKGNQEDAEKLLRETLNAGLAQNQLGNCLQFLFQALENTTSIEIMERFELIRDPLFQTAKHCYLDPHVYNQKRLLAKLPSENHAKALELLTRTKSDAGKYELGKRLEYIFESLDTATSDVIMGKLTALGKKP